MIRLRLLAVAVLGTSLLTAAPAYADFDPVPLACHARISPWEGRVVFSVYNPNATTTYVDYGNDNIMLESPNFMAGQPTEFAPGLGEGRFLGRYDDTYPGPGHRTWYLSGTIANARDGACDGVDEPVNTVAPRFTEDPVAGQAVFVEPGTWTGGGPGGVWQTALLESCGEQGCRRIGLAGSRSYVDVDSSPTPISFPVPGNEVGARLRVVVATYSWRGVTLAASPLSAPVGGSAAPSAPDPQVVDGGWPDYETPVVLGGTAVPPRSRLDWLGFPRPALSFAWQRCTGGDCSDIPGADELTYRLVAADVGHSLRVRITGTNASGSASSTTQAVAIDSTMPSGTSPAVAVETPTLAGTPQVGAALTARPGSWLTTDAFRYQWQRCASTCEDIGGADAASYVATPADAGSRLRAVVLATGGAGTRTNRSAVARFSTEPSEPVVAAPVTPVTPVTPPPPPGVNPSPATPTVGDEVAPRITAVRLTRWRTSRGTILRFTVSEAASLRIDVRRPHRSRPWATLRRTVAPGSHQVRIAGRVEQRRLRPGRHTLTVLATDESGNRSSPVTRRFTVSR